MIKQIFRIFVNFDKITPKMPNFFQNNVNFYDQELKNALKNKNDNKNHSLKMRKNLSDPKKRVKKPPKPPKNRRIFRIFWWILGIFVLFFIFFVATLQDDVEKIKNYDPSLTTQILDRNGRIIANLPHNGYRFYAKFSEIPPRLIEALLAIEDTLFFEHNGLNFDAILRAILKNIYHSKYAEGGSTLTQQLVKNLVLTRDKTIMRKIKEAIISTEIEILLSKEQILERYLNDTFFGHGYYGVKAAALGYFDKNLNQLSLKEIAILASLPRAPSYYDPAKNLHISLSRANQVISRMQKLGWISDGEYKAAISEVPEISDGISQNLAPYVTDMVIRELNFLSNLRTGGYKILLNVDLDYQKIAQNVMKTGHQRAKKINANDQNEDHLNGAMVVTDPKTGGILALVGGVDYKKSVFNRATQARRQIGSIVKPFIYQYAFDSGYSPATVVADVERSFGTDEELWRPKNVGNAFNGIVHLREALIRSLNLATLNLVDTLGFERVVEALETYGLNISKRDMTIVLGSMVQSPLQIARAYSLFSNDGVMTEPRLISQILKNDEIFSNFSPEMTQKTTKEQSFLVRQILQDVVLLGTGRLARVRGLEIAGKTGTTNDNHDAWFVGFSPDVQVVLWFGNDDNTSIGKIGGSAGIVAPIFADFMTQALKIHPEMRRKFQRPKNVYEKTIDGVKYFYTDTSKLPQKNVENDHLIF